MTVGLRILEQSPQAQCRTDAIISVQKALGGDASKYIGADTILEDRVLLEILAKVIIDPDALTPVFRDAEELGQFAYPCELALLWDAWNEMQVRYIGSSDVIKTEAWYTQQFGVLKEGLRSFPFLPKRYRDVADLLLCSSERVSSILEVLESPPETWQASLTSLKEKWGSDTLCYTGARSPRIEH